MCLQTFFSKTKIKNSSVYEKKANDLKNKKNTSNIFCCFNFMQSILQHILYFDSKGTVRKASYFIL